MGIETEWIITRTPTIGDGIVYRWYRSTGAEANGSAAVSASRNCVEVDTSVRTPEECVALLAIIGAAWSAKEDLVDRIDPTHLVTHERSGLSGPLVPVGSEDDVR